MSCLFVSIDQPIKGLWWEAYWFWRPKGQGETTIKQDGGWLNSFQPQQPHVCRMKACSLCLESLRSSFHRAQWEGSRYHLSYSISGGSTVCVILASCHCNANKELASFSDIQNVTCHLSQCVCVRVCVCARKRWVVGWGWVLAQGESRQPLRPASDEFI